MTSVEKAIVLRKCIDHENYRVACSEQSSVQTKRLTDNLNRFKRSLSELLSEMTAGEVAAYHERYSKLRVVMSDWVHSNG